MSHSPTPAPSDAQTTADRSQLAARVPHRWRNLATLTGVTVVDNAEAGLTSTLFPTIARALGLDNGHLGILAAVGRLVSVPFGPAWVWVASKTSRRFALVLTTVFAGAFGIAAGFAQNFTVLLIFNTLMAAALIGGQPISNAVISDSFDDRSRGKAVGMFYGSMSLLTAVLGPLIAQLSNFSDGWRWGMWSLGGICMLAAVGVLVFFRDPGVGASETQLVDMSAAERDKARPSIRSVLALFTVPSFAIMLVSRLLSGHLLIVVFGLQFLVTERGFSNAVASLVLFPFGVGYFLGTFGGGFATSWLDRVFPARGRVAFLQVAQILFAVIAFFGTQFDYGNIGIYGVFWGLMGLAQGLNPGVNRPIVMSVTLPELRGQAFAIFITIFEAIGWAIFTLSAGVLADAFSIQTVFLWVLVILMIVNGIVITALYVTYPRDVRRVDETLDARRDAAVS
ncbi:MFS transporter [Microbacterium sp. MPKO10]|uniref:MFS transporter n=1 Tax=Microbacterium sp. MPKO10 TaxID=2989818 RepID=UPI0022366F71|nr:MFS transporter [Microbacterium sp. MPKO10]MCW4458800.1 MFS transporter [Microbacterium sp. MPKO10]